MFKLKNGNTRILCEIYLNDVILVFLILTLNRFHTDVFPGPRPSAWPPALAPNLCLPALAPNLYLMTLTPNLYLQALAPNFYLPALVSPEHGLAYTNLVPPICIYWPWPTIFITVLWFCIYLLIYSSSSGSSNISNSSNFLGLDNTNISMPILVN